MFFFKKKGLSKIEHYDFKQINGDHSYISWCLKLKETLLRERIEVVDNFTCPYLYKYPYEIYIAQPLNSTITEVKVRMSQFITIEITDIDNKFFDGFYFKASENNYSGIILQFKANWINVKQKDFNNALDGKIISEIQRVGNCNHILPVANLGLLPYLLVFSLLNQLIGKKFNYSFSEVEYIKYVNSHEENIRFLKQCTNNIEEVIDDNDRYWFVRIYYWNLKIISSLGTNEPLSFHDVGTCSAFFPLLLSALSPSELLGVNVGKIIASDLYFVALQPALRILEEQKDSYKNIDFIKLDLTKSIYNIPVCDVVIANDVLEHFPEAESFEILQKLWDKTGKLLLIHVPFEDYPNPAHGHICTFNEHKLISWGSTLKNAEIISGDFYDWDKKLIELGYLCLKKIKML